MSNEERKTLRITNEGYSSKRFWTLWNGIPCKVKFKLEDVGDKTFLVMYFFDRNNDLLHKRVINEDTPFVDLKNDLKDMIADHAIEDLLFD